MPAHQSAIADLVALIPRVARTGTGDSWEERNLTRAICRHGAEAVPLLLPYLEHPLPGVRALTACILQEGSGVRPDDLPALMRQVKRGKYEFAPAIARIGTPQAIRFLIERLRHGGDYQGPLYSALSQLGTRATPYLCDLIRTVAPMPVALPRTVAGIFADFDARAKKAAVQPLLRIVLDLHLPLPNREAAIHSLEGLGEPAVAAVPALSALSRQVPALKPAVDEALVVLNVPQAVPVLLHWLRQSSTLYRPIVLRNIANIGPGAHSAGPFVMEYLNDSDWETRVAAARALGFISYRESVFALIALLSDKDDWRRVDVAAESLGRLAAQNARDALRKVANTHWYAPVRETAREALMHIDARTAYPASPPGANFAVLFFRWANFGKQQTLPEPRNPVGNRLEVPGGTLVGEDKGEWGGGLTFIPTVLGGKKQVVTKQIISALARLGKDGSIIAIGSQVFAGTNVGLLFLVEPDPKGAWRAMPWKALPGAAEWAVVLPAAEGREERLRVACYSATVDVTADGDIHVVP